MKKYRCTLVCWDNLNDVASFLEKFFTEVFTSYNHSTWRSFQIPEQDFYINIMEGSDLLLTQDMVFEIECDSFDCLQSYASNFDCDIQMFYSEQSSQKYNYHYIEVNGPKNICKIEISYSENIT